MEYLYFVLKSHFLILMMGGRNSPCSGDDTHSLRHVVLLLQVVLQGFVGFKAAAADATHVRVLSSVAVLEVGLQGQRDVN